MVVCFNDLFERGKLGTVGTANGSRIIVGELRIIDVKHLTSYVRALNACRRRSRRSRLRRCLHSATGEVIQGDESIVPKDDDDERHD
jgi:hypothetical protein